MLVRASLALSPVNFNCDWMVVGLIINKSLVRKKGALTLPRLSIGPTQDTNSHKATQQHPTGVNHCGGLSQNSKPPTSTPLPEILGTQFQRITQILDLLKKPRKIIK